MTTSTRFADIALHGRVTRRESGVVVTGAPERLASAGRSFTRRMYPSMTALEVAVYYPLLDAVLRTGHPRLAQQTWESTGLSAMT